MISENKLSNLQIELLKMFRYNLSETQLLEIRELLTAYFSKNISDEMDKLWKDNNWNDETITQWLNDHSRTPYSHNP